MSKKSGGVQIPADWEFIQTVMPRLKMDRLGQYPREARRLMKEGLATLEGTDEATTTAVVGRIAFNTKTGLRLPVDDQAREDALRICRRYSREAATSGNAKWSVRKLLITALYIRAFQESVGEKRSQESTAA